MFKPANERLGRPFTYACERFGLRKSSAAFSSIPPRMMPIHTYFETLPPNSSYRKISSALANHRVDSKNAPSQINGQNRSETMKAAIKDTSVTLQPVFQNGIPSENSGVPSTGKPAKSISQLPTAFGCPRDFLGNRFVYAVISPRAHGLSIGINMNPDKHCNFDCSYCEVNRLLPATQQHLDLEMMAIELQNTLDLVRSGRIRELSFFKRTPAPLLELRQVALSGDGEPTICPNFTKAVETLTQIRARSVSFFKIVLITNASGLDLPEVQAGLKCFTRADEIWAKLEAGTQDYFTKVNHSDIPLEKILANILLIGRQRPIIIQSLFPSLNGQVPPWAEIDQYAQRLKELKEAGAQISRVQIYSATRPTTHHECGHLQLKILSRIASTVRQTSGLEAAIF
jgi:wyosine [tRNA(Phe)-imidazoG37] synthetase (radical SAM superfamily)